MKFIRAFLKFLEAHMMVVLLVAAVIIALFSLDYYYYAGYVLAYGDAESHINIAKRVIDGLTPGVGQLGGVWLPLHHMLMVPFVINDFMWRTGLGGVIVSAVGFVASSLFVFKITKQLTNSAWIGLLAFLIYSLNPNILYMLATPMSELLLLAFLTGSIYFFIKWIYKPNLLTLILAALFIFAGCLVRYDAWFVAVIECLALLCIGIANKWGYKKLEAMFILFGTLAFFGCVLWFAWSLVIFHDPLYFMNSPYSAKSQQLSFMATGQLPTYHSLYESVRYYLGATVLNSGLPIFITGVIGAIAFLIGKRKDISKRFVVMGLLLSTFAFNVAALFLGISILFVPGITPADSEFQLFNIRYGLMMIPALAILTGILVYRFNNKVIRLVLAAIVLVIVGMFMFTNPITLKDGTSGLSSRRIADTSPIFNSFNSSYDYGYVAFDDFARSANPISLNVPLNKMIYVGAHPYWEEMLEHPNEYARWLIVRKDDVLYKKFNDTKVLSNDYEVITKDKDVTLYKCVNNCAPESLVLAGAQR